MNITLQRVYSTDTETVGILRVNGKFECWTLEDRRRAVKVDGETRIPEGTYNIKLRTQGGMTKRYAAKFPEHLGMVWLQDVDDFEWVYIHIGNTHEDTDGCVLVGRGVITGNKCSLTSSTTAYRALYSKIIDALREGHRVRIKIRSDDDV